MAADREQHRERDREQHDRDGRAPVPVAALDLVEDEDRRDLGLVRQVARDDHERADLADRARERERDAREDPREDVRQHDPAEDRQLARAERARRLLHLACRARAAPAAPCGRRTGASRRAARGRSRCACRRRGCRPASAARRARGATRPATIVGSANGRSMIALTNDLPRKSSRTSTQAMIVPSDGVDERDERRRRRASASAPRRPPARRDAAQKPDAARPRATPRRAPRSAATTMTVRNVGDEAEGEGRPALSLGCADERATATGDASQSSVLRPPVRSATIRPLFGSNQTLSALRQPPMNLSSILKMPGRVGNFVSVASSRPFGSTGRKPYWASESWAGVGLDEADELVRDVLVRAVLQHRDRELDQHRLPRDHVLDVLAVQAAS